jgi:hypothetical protein
MTMIALIQISFKREADVHAGQMATVRNPALPMDESGVLEDRAELR